MSSRIVELTETQSIVLGTIKRYKCLSAAEIAHWTQLSVSSIEQAIPVLDRARLILLSSSGGLPKRYCPREVASVKEDDNDVWDDDSNYTAEIENESVSISS